MYRIALAAVLFFLACNNDKPVEDENSFNYESFSGRFKVVTVPYTLSDTGFLRNRDTATIRSIPFAKYIPDSLKKKVFGTTKLRYVPMAKMEKKDSYSFYILKAIGGTKKIALLVVFDKVGNYGGAFPFLNPDNDGATTQMSTIDRSFSITRSVTRRMPDDISKDGKDVYAWSPDTKSFSLVMTDILDDRNVEVINPIDTMPRTHALAGDYKRGKRNIVSIRDGSSASVINFFIHFDNEAGDCSGELKGSAVLTSSKTAVYRQGGDPCVMEFHFSGNTVTLKEVEGCGSRRGLKCSFDAAYTRSKPAKSSKTVKKK
jgi:hypothetical protein